MNFEKFVAITGIISIAILATSTVALADESIFLQSIALSEIEGEIPISPLGTIQEISWLKKVSNEGIIEISGINYSVNNNDSEPHAYEVCFLIEGPNNVFMPNVNEDPVCQKTSDINGNSIMENLVLDFPRGIKVSELKDISFTIEEID
ncbi:hypothetical protein [Nitrosopumilus sp.]|uniref:hypothetical protein n=1 Tax=Nitrosopumilus sp. TaxID=2024843 RepID=UPI002613EA60|nr:hypothetical protein [Nitrosopumilus sp.]